MKTGKEEVIINNFELNESEIQLLAGRIKLARKKAGYTQNEIAEQIDCSVGHLSAIENGKVMPSGNELVAFCKLYRIDLHYLFTKLLPFYIDEAKPQPELGSLNLNLNLVSDEAIRWNIQVFQEFIQVLMDEKERRKK